MDLSKYSDETWDRFFDFIFDDRDLTREEVQRELADAGIDMRPARERLRKLLEKHREKRRTDPNADFPSPRSERQGHRLHALPRRA